MRDALAALTAAKRPVIVAGGGVMRSGAQAEVVELAEKLRIPVATSLNAKAAMLDAHPLAVGVPGAYSRDCANRVLHEADLVFFIGSHCGGQVTNNWMFPPPGTRVIQLDIDPNELGRNYPNVVSILGDAKVSLRRMIDAAPRAAAGEGRLERARAADRRRVARRERRDARFRRDADTAGTHLQGYIGDARRPMAWWCRTPATPESGPRVSSS